MLFKHRFLSGIRAGETTLAFRRWRRPSVRAGGTLKTAVGVLAIESVEPITESGITAEDAHRAGYPRATSSSLSCANERRACSIA